MSKRLLEIYQALRGYYQTVEIEVMGTWASRANMERYFKYRYCNFNYKIGTLIGILTEYFRFANPSETQRVEWDLQQTPAKVLSPAEQEIIDGKTDKFIAAMLTDKQVHG